jgi:hypothetical protein
MPRSPAIPLALAALCAACSEPSGRPPIARIDLSPAYVLAADNYRTPVTLDGSRSSDEVDDPTATRPLHFGWRLDPSFRVASGAIDSASLTVLVPGDRPRSLTLVVADSDDALTTSATAVIGVTTQ